MNKSSISTDIHLDHRLTSAYQNLFSELSNDGRYRTYSVAEFYCNQNKQRDLDRVNVIVRIDVDYGFHLSIPLAEALCAYGIHSTHYFLTHPTRYYQLWNSGIPRKVYELGHEVGLHSDHYYEQLVYGVDGLKQLRADISHLSQEIGTNIRGMVYHGHLKIDELRTTNWELTKDLVSSDLGLDYHDGLKSCYIKPNSRSWQPDCDLRITDYMGFPKSWGWNYYPNYPLRLLRQAQPGQIVHLSFHTHNAFRYWANWENTYKEEPIHRDNLATFWYKALSIRFKFGLLKSRTLKNIIFYRLIGISSSLLVSGLGLFWRTPKEAEPNISWEVGRKRIYQYGIPFWRHHLEMLGMTQLDATVLEVGSGNGQWLLAYAKDAREVIGVEPSRNIREYSVKKISEYPQRKNKIKVLDGSAENLPLADASVDIVFCSGVFMFTHQEQALQEIARVIKPGGKICLTVNGLGYFVMYILNGLRYKSVEKMAYGLTGFWATLIKWRFGKEIHDAPTAVNLPEMELKLKSVGLKLIDTRIWLPEYLYPTEHLGFVTNYAFIALKD